MYVSAIYREESATEALRNVLNRSDNPWEDDDEIDIGIDSEMLNDPLTHMQIISVEGTAIPQKSASFSCLGPFSEDSNRNNLGRISCARKSKSRTADLLDRILNDEDEILTKSIANEESLGRKSESNRTLTGCSADTHDRLHSSQHSTCGVLEKLDPEEKSKDLHQSDSQMPNQDERTDSTNQSTSTKRYSHQRSTSDIGVRSQTKGLMRDRYASVCSPDILSTSLPVSEGVCALCVIASKKLINISYLISCIQIFDTYVYFSSD